MDSFGFSKSIVLSALAVVMVTLPVAMGQWDPSCMDTLPDDMIKCFDDRDLLPTVMPPTVDVLQPGYKSLEVTLTYMDPVVYCDTSRERTAYSDAAKCTADLQQACMDPNGDGTISGPDDWKNLMSALCANRDALDVTCFKNFFPLTSDCARYKMDQLDPSVMGSPTVFCIANDIAYDCQETMLRPLCGDNTTDIYLNLLSEHTTPPLCRNSSMPDRPDRPRYFEFLTAPETPAANALGNGGSNIPISVATNIIAAVAVVVAVGVGRWE